MNELNAPGVSKSETQSTTSETSPAEAGFKIQKLQTKESRISDCVENNSITPSPLAGEGEGEGDTMHPTSILKFPRHD